MGSGERIVTIMVGMIYSHCIPKVQSTSNIYTVANSYFPNKIGFKKETLKLSKMRMEERSASSSYFIGLFY